MHPHVTYRTLIPKLEVNRTEKRQMIRRLMATARAGLRPPPTQKKAILRIESQSRREGEALKEIRTQAGFSGRQINRFNGLERHSRN
jgi:hypothetical protein